MSNDIQKDFEFKSESLGVTVKGSIPKSAFEQQDLFMLLMFWHKSQDLTTWNKIRNIIIANSKVLDNIGVEIKASEASLEVLNLLTEKYMDMALSFFTSLLA